MKWVPGDPSNIFLVTSFTWKRPESSDFMYSSIFMLENIWHLKLREGHMHSLQVPEAKRNENKKKKQNAVVSILSCYEDLAKSSTVIYLFSTA